MSSSSEYANYLAEFVETHQREVRVSSSEVGLAWEFNYDLFEGHSDVIRFAIDKKGNETMGVVSLRWGKDNEERGASIDEVVLFAMKAKIDLPDSRLTLQLVDYARDRLNQMLELLPNHSPVSQQQAD